jgi:hypothetical protein
MKIDLEDPTTTTPTDALIMLLNASFHVACDFSLSLTTVMSACRELDSAAYLVRKERVELAIHGRIP